MRKVALEEFNSIAGKYFPPESIDFVFPFFENHSFYFKITRPRLSKKGDFKYSLVKKAPSTISVNCNLCTYEFFLVFIHEFAHYLVYQNYSSKAKSHGEEWKNEYDKLLSDAIRKIKFPEDIRQAFSIHLKNIKSSSSIDPDLEAVFENYRGHDPQLIFLKNLNPGDHFVCRNELFIMDEFVRTRARCTLLKSNRKYLISGLMKVKYVSNKNYS